MPLGCGPPAWERDPSLSWRPLTGFPANSRGKLSPPARMACLPAVKIGERNVIRPSCRSRSPLLLLEGLFTLDFQGCEREHPGPSQDPHEADAPLPGPCYNGLRHMEE
jgi:hypothetical protein